MKKLKINREGEKITKLNNDNDILDKMSEEALAFHERIVWHDTYYDILESITRARRMQAMEPVGVMILGESGHGKTFFIERYKKENKPNKSGDIDQVPCLYLETPPILSTEGYLSDLLEMLGDPQPDQGTMTRKRRRVQKLIKELGVQLVFIDEYQDILSQKNLQEKSRGIKFIKWLMNKNVGVSVALSGLPECKQILFVDKQMRTRFDAVHILSPLTMLNKYAESHYIVFLEKLVTVLPRELYSPVNMEFCERLLLASMGIPRTLKKLLSTAIDETRGAEIIQMKDLQMAWMKVTPCHLRLETLCLPFESTLSDVKSALRAHNLIPNEET